MNGFARMNDLLSAAGIGTLVNFPWEMAHSLLYRGSVGLTWDQHFICCGLASLVDGIGTAAIFGIGAHAFRDPRWTRQVTPERLALAVFLGLIGAATTEWLALRLGWWTYSPAMPRVPGTDLGASPLAQFVVL